MQASGIAVILLGGMLVAPAYCFALVRGIRPLPALTRFGFWVAVTGLMLFAVELAFVGMWGNLGTRAHLGPLFFRVHAGRTVCAAPACGCVPLLGKRSLARAWPGVAVLVWIAGAAALFYFYRVAETLYGIGGIGGPYLWP
ncbi:MAG: hypothetical protein JSS29_13840 [Proteobacteria bacterium]|nr:hypothetical protein [Pseudomonadota bacterium]